MKKPCAFTLPEFIIDNRNLKSATTLTDKSKILAPLSTECAT
jgi:hypothetical protein